MKKIVLSTKILILSMLFVLPSCSSSSDDDAGNGGGGPIGTPQHQVLETLLINESWTVSYYYHNDQEETDSFNFYGFDFFQSNRVESSDGFETYIGTWSVTDGSNDDILVNLSFASPEVFSQLTKTWKIINFDESFVELVENSNSGGNPDKVTFRKI
ncbi:hypothetical protein [Hanstruepera ponticola]|uniref:hypothetical protein n=1 Tax=Hanstruepera ponticola TaxID=2042995 RepID=UPI0013C4F6B3|nr:hypothetical protein [Hanstruepera ponticola]